MGPRIPPRETSHITANEIPRPLRYLSKPPIDSEFPLVGNFVPGLLLRTSTLQHVEQTKRKDNRVKRAVDAAAISLSEVLQHLPRLAHRAHGLSRRLPA